MTETRLDEIADGIYRISTPVPVVPGGFSFNQYLVADDEPLLFHTGLRRLFPGIREAIERVMPLDRLRWVALSHFEADECGALNELLAAAPRAEPVCSRIAKMTSLDDYADRPARALADGEVLSLGRHAVAWQDAPHLPHGWECGYLHERKTATLLCGDLFTQPGTGDVALTESDVLGPSEALRARLEYFARGPESAPLLEKLAALAPRTLACMHGSAWRGDGAALLRALAARLAPSGDRPAAAR
jgi:flavorubredoxin